MSLGSRTTETRPDLEHLASIASDELPGQLARYALAAEADLARAEEALRAIAAVRYDDFLHKKDYAAHIRKLAAVPVENKPA